MKVRWSTDGSLGDCPRDSISVVMWASCDAGLSRKTSFSQRRKAAKKSCKEERRMDWVGWASRGPLEVVAVVGAAVAEVAAVGAVLDVSGVAVGKNGGWIGWVGHQEALRRS